VTSNHSLEPYVPRIVVEWLRDDPDALWREVEGSLAFVDVSGFTALTEKLARKGKVGAEELSDILNDTFGALLDHAYADGAGLVKWGGDAMLLLFEGEGHAGRATHAAVRMRGELSRIGTFGSGRSRVVLRMSVGIHSGAFHFSLVGDPTIHRELIVAGPAATRTAEMEMTANADQVVVSSETAALLDPRCVGDAVGEGFVLTSAPTVAGDHRVGRPPSDGLDLATMLPPPIRRHLQAARGESEHRRISVGFVAFSGTDALYASRGPAALAMALDECVRAVQAATQRAGVTFFESDIDRDGGKLMLTAGAPTSAHGDEERMLLAARAIVEADLPLPIRVGVNRGQVFTGDFGPDFRRTYSVKGDAVNLAARLLGKAHVREVVATRAVIDHSAAQFEMRPIEPFTVKGKSELVEAVRVGPLVGSETTPVRESPMVGREFELDVMREQYERALNGQGGLVVISGEPGIGKSRIVAEALRDLETAVLFTRGDPYESSTAYWPFRSLLRDLVGVTADAQDADVLAALTARAEPRLAPWIPLIASVMDIEAKPTIEVDSLADDFRRKRLEEATTAFIRSVVAPGTVVVFDDVHLFDDASSTLLTRIARDSAQSAVLVVATRREVNTGFVADDEMAQIALHPKPLDGDAVRVLLRQELDDLALAPHDLETLSLRAGGNPLFVRGLVEAARAGDSIDSLPETIEALVTSLLDRLPPDQRAVLRFASVLGMTFREIELNELLQNSHLQPQASVMSHLTYFIRPESDGFRFDHQLIRDTAYEGLPYRVRRDLHGRAGDLIERNATDPHDVAELLSLHFLSAGRPEPAWNYARVAGDRAVAKSAYAQAEELYARAIEASRSLRSVGARERADVHVKVGDARRRLGRSEGALAAFRTARALLSDTDPLETAGVLAREANVYRRMGRYPVALRFVSRGLTLLEANDEPTALAARSELEMISSGVRSNQGRYRDALIWARRAEADAAAAGDVETRADAAAMIHGALLMLGTPDRRYGEEALRWYEQAGDRLRQSEALNNLAMLSWAEGNGAEALSEFQRAHVLASESGDSFQAAATQVNVGDVLMRMGRLFEAEAQLRDCLSTLRAVGARTFEAVAWRCLGVSLAQQGDANSGLEWLKRARAQQELLGERDEVIETDASIAFVYLISGDAVAAAELADDAAVRAVSLEADHLLPLVLRVQGAALTDLGRDDRARVVLVRALDLASHHSVVESGFICAELVRLAEDPGAAERYQQQANESWGRLGFVGTQRYPRG